MNTKLQYYSHVMKMERFTHQLFIFLEKTDSPYLPFHRVFRGYHPVQGVLGDHSLRGVQRGHLDLGGPTVQEERLN